MGLGGLLGAFFLAELGDKTSLATAALATTHGIVPVCWGDPRPARRHRPRPLAGGVWLQRRVRPRLLRRLGAVAFLAVGVATLATTLW